MEERKIVVVGAGLTGLTCAAYLRRKGQDVVVLEAADRIGGLMQTEEIDGFIMEQGPSTGTIKHPEVAELFDMLGDDCTLEVAQSSAKCRLIWKDGRFHALPSGLWSAITTPLLTLQNKISRHHSDASFMGFDLLYFPNAPGYNSHSLCI